MTEQLWIRSHVEQLLTREWNLCRVAVDPDGDIPFRRGTAACWVSVLDLEPVMVRVLAHACYGLRPSARLLRELNDVQARSVSARVELVDDIAVVSQTISPVGLTQPVLAQALDAVAFIADDIGWVLASMFDGRTPYELERADAQGEDAAGPS